MTTHPRAPAVVTPERFPTKIWLISLAGWMFDFYDLVLFSFLLIPIGHELHLTAGQEAVLLGVALGGSGIGGIFFGYLSDLRGRRFVMTVDDSPVLAGNLPDRVFDRLLVAAGVPTDHGPRRRRRVGGRARARSRSRRPPRMRGRASAMLQAGEPMGVGLAALVGFLLAPIIGWRAVFLVSSASALMALDRPPAPARVEAVGSSRRTSVCRRSRRCVLIKRYRLVGVSVKGFLLGVFKLGTYWTCYTWLPKFLQQEFHQPIGRSALWILTAQLGQFLGMLVFGYLADRYGRRLLFTLFSLLTAAALYPLAFHWQALLPHPLLFWGALFALGLGSGCTAGFGALLAELFPTDIRNFAMGTTYNTARGVQFFAPIVVSLFVARYGLTGGLSVPLALALATATWVWTLPETRGRDLATVGKGNGGN